MVIGNVGSECVQASGSRSNYILISGVNYLKLRLDYFNKKSNNLRKSVLLTGVNKTMPITRNIIKEPLKNW